MPAAKKQGARAASPARRSTVPAVASTLIVGIPSASVIAQAIATKTKLYVDTDGEEGQSIIPALIANATTPESLFAGSELEKVEDHFGETLKVLGINSVNNSDFKDGLGVYLVVTVITSDGETFPLGVGSADAMAKLAALNDMNAFPYDVAFVQATKATKRGFYPVNLESRQVELF